MKKNALFLSLFIFTCSILGAASFNESVAGNITVQGEKVGVLVVDLTSHTYPLRLGSKTISPPDTFFTAGIKAELINKGASVMVLNPPGMEKLLSQFIVVDKKKGQFSSREELAANITTVTKSAMGSHSRKVQDSQTHPQGMELVRELMNSTEFSGEIDRITQYTEFYNKFIKLWGVTRLITVEVKGQYNYIVRGYEIDGASAGLVFQYFLKTDKDMFSKIETNIGTADVKDENGFTILDNADVKPESSDKRVYEVIKRVSQFFK